MSKQYLFICGAPRSGTSALCNLMNLHPNICVGMERYYHKILRDDELDPELFTLPRLLDYQPTDSFWPEAIQSGFFINKYERAMYVGEKLPKLYEKFNLLRENFLKDSVKILFIFREVLGVAESYTAQRFRIK